MENKMEEDSLKPSKNFIELIIDEDIKINKNNSRVHTRFPAEPNGYLPYWACKIHLFKFRYSCKIQWQMQSPV